MLGLGSSKPDNRRQQGRLKCEYFYCRDEKDRLGVVLDLSATGMRMCHKGKLRSEVDENLILTLYWGDSNVKVDVRVRWIRKIGFRMHLIGLEFINMTSSRATAIQNLSRIARKALTYD